MAVEKALDFSNPLISSRISLERALEEMTDTFNQVGSRLAKKRIKKAAATIKADLLDLTKEIPLQ